MKFVFRVLLSSHTVLLWFWVIVMRFPLPLPLFSLDLPRRLVATAKAGIMQLHA
jgi:hypothetical protein